MIDTVILSANSKLAISIFKHRLKNEERSIVIRDLFECLIIAIRSEAGVHVEINGIRWNDKNCGKNRYEA